MVQFEPQEAVGSVQGEYGLRSYQGAQGLLITLFGGGNIFLVFLEVWYIYYYSFFCRESNKFLLQNTNIFWGGGVISN